MKVGLSYPVNELRGGAVGRSGLVFFPWRGLQVARLFSTPANPSSLNQAAVRAYQTASSKAFKDLSPAERAAWDSYALLYATQQQGVQFVPPTNSMYSQVNFWRQVAGQALSDTAPTAKPAWAVTGITSITKNGTNLEIAFTHSASSPTGEFVAVKMSGKVSSLNTRVFEGDYRLALGASKSGNVVALSASPQTITIALANLWTAVTTDDVVGVSLLPLSSEYAPGTPYAEVQAIA